MEKWKFDSEKLGWFVDVVCRRFALGLWPLETLGVGNLCEALLPSLFWMVGDYVWPRSEGNAGGFVFLIPPVRLSTALYW